MKKKGLFIAVLLIFVFTLGFLNNKASASKIQPNISDYIKVISSDADLKIGEFGFITIQGQPEKSYHIRTTYKRGDRTFNVEQIRLTDENGQATFNWFVENDTTPGKYTATITGDGEPIEITHTVKE